ncbi:MAG: TfoX/Sxy family protein [Lewinellaceae bacterium]|nr:TfoX/Sxy family protein [Lewinellaceae bacterium]
MAYDEFLAERIRRSLQVQRAVFTEKRMMGGLTFLVEDKMCVGVVGDNLMARIDPEIYEVALQKPGAREMDFTGRPMKGYVFVEPEGVDREEDLAAWVKLCLAFNPKAKSSKRKKE